MAKKFLGMSGSLRTHSSNTMLLHAAQDLAPEGISIDIYQGTHDLPHFNPDIELQDIKAVTDLRSVVCQVDGIIMSCPEYAHGIPGAFKNTLDWLVGEPGFYEKPVIFLNVENRAFYARAALKEVIKTMSGKIIEEACTEFPPSINQMNLTAFKANPEVSQQMQTTLLAFAEALSQDMKTS